MKNGPDIFKSTCSYCGVGCGVEIVKHRDGSMELRGDEAHPANRGLLCSKGRSLLHTVNARQARLHYPMMRERRGEPRERVSWDAAMAHAAGKFRQIIDAHGPDAVAFYISGQCLTEEYYLANKIVKGFLGTNNIDSNSRLCMSSAVAGYKETLGADGPPVCYEDIDLADTFLIAGANPAWCHPVLFRRIEARKLADPAVKVIVIDPRRTASAEIADLHLQLRPGTDVSLFLGMARCLVHAGQIDRDFLAGHVEGTEDFLRSVESWTLSRTAEATGLPEEQIAQAAEWLGGPRRFLSLWTMGLNQSAVGTDKNVALISLSLITGKIGKPGCGPFSLTGQPNAMGGREVGGMANLLPAHRDLKNAADRAEVARFWGVPAISEKPGLTAVELFDAMGAGKVKAVWIVATNPVASMPAAWRVEKALATAELVVVQDIYPTETTDLADLVLPAAGWLEKSGTMTNSDRRVSLLEKATEPPGEAMADAEILQQFARAMGWEEQFGHASAADIFAEHARLTAGTDVDISGLSHALLKLGGPVRWPFPKVKHPRAKYNGRLYMDHLFPTASGRARLRGIEFENRSELLTAEFPLILTTGRIRDQWHTMTKTGQVNRLNAHVGSPFCEIHPNDARARDIAEGELVTVTGARGTVRLRAVVTADIRQGVVFVPMHWGKKLGGERGRVNNITSPRIDPVSKEPDLKFAAVEVERFVAPRRRIVIIGAGAAAFAFVEHHRMHNKDDDIVLLGGESLPVYDRVMLPHYIDGTASWPSLIRADGETLAPHRVIFHPNTLVARVDRANRIVTDARGRAFAYDTLIFATGSRPAIHYDGPLPDAGVFTLRSRNDADAILKEALPGRKVVIHGGGLLGIELADALTHRGCAVTIVQRSGRLMGKQLDAAGSAVLVEELLQRGIAVRLNTTLIEVTGRERVTGVRMSTNAMEPDHAGAADTETIGCDLFIFATGILPNKELAGAAGLDCDRGILVSRFLETSDPAVYAIGECAEFNGQTFGTTAAAREQAAALADYLRGNEHAPYRGSVTANILKLRDFPVASAGITDPDPTDRTFEVVTLSDVRRGFYQKCVIQQDRLVGVICIGDVTRFSQYLQWIATGLELEELRRTLLRPGATGENSSIDGKLICSCHQVGSGTIEKSAADHDGNLMKVCGATKAGTGCGSCRPEVAKLLRMIQKKEQEVVPAAVGEGEEVSERALV